MSFDKTQAFFNEMSFFTLCNAAPGLGKFFGEPITVSTARTELATFGEIKKRAENWIYSSISFNKGDIGNTHIFFEKKDGLELANYAIEKKLGIKEGAAEWNELSINTVEEVINILGGNMTEILNVIFGEDIEIDVPELFLEMSEPLESCPEERNMVLNTFTLRLGMDRKVTLREMAEQRYYESLISQLKNKV